MVAVCAAQEGIVDSTLVFVVVGLIMIGMGVYWIKTGQREVLDFSDALDTFRQAGHLVDTYAPAADQLVKIEAIAKEDRLDYVLDMIESYGIDLDMGQVRGIVEAWVREHKEKKE